MKDNSIILGIDIGSIAVSVAAISKNRKILQTSYTFHRGDVTGTLEKELAGFDLTSTAGIAVTGSASGILKNYSYYDNRIAYINAVKNLYSNIGSLLIIGGEKFGIVTFDEEGDYLNFRSNSSCAAGTGSFLDQQAKRLNLSSIEDFCSIAVDNKGSIPKIASRCAVFAKTDLIHSQQEGFSLAEISDGLCFGLAKNVVDTLFAGHEIRLPLVLAGGVSRNQAVARHIGEMLETELIIDDYSHLYGALGASLSLADEISEDTEIEISNIDDILVRERHEKSYFYEPLQLQYSEYPDFTSLYKYEYTSKYFPMATPVEVDVYEEIQSINGVDCYAGIDIGSTSTKAVLTDNDGTVLAGLYTRTSGRPLEAVQTIFESIDDIKCRYSIEFNIKGIGTTGSGRKFIGEIIGSDLILDEISAHARAAYQLDEEVDTIIEIGGQDAKFTTMNKGMVTLSIMNNVCAAGTGSFIEEQANKLNCSLHEYSDRAENVKAPLSSDRCTVFMERDLNHYLNENYDVNEILASVLHSVRENYLSKVAEEGSIGKKIFFQGATAKNKALVAAFEQRLERPIMVSKFCHLTGALGVALNIIDMDMVDTTFRGLELYKETIPVTSEVCDLCNNNCKLKIAKVNNDSVAYGFLCGRDYEEQSFVSGNKSDFDMNKFRKKAFAFTKKDTTFDVIIGLPYALHLVEEYPLWQRFFNELSIKTLSSENYKDAIREGKKIAGAEFCAPMSAIHGHVRYLSEKADYVFLPNYLEADEGTKDERRNYCYYTQYVPTVVTYSLDEGSQYKILSPALKTIQSGMYMRKELFKMINGILPDKFTSLQVSMAYEKTLKWFKKSQRQMQDDVENLESDKEVKAVLLGRPYSILPSSMNSGIPGIFGKLGVKAFFQDMIASDEKVTDEIKPLLSAIHWNYASKIIQSAHAIAQSEGAYPVLVTSFKCTPDSIITEYFKQVMESYDKPYLILQLDEHDSSVGYETRIEAGIRSFRNHMHRGDIKTEKTKIPIPEVAGNSTVFKGKTLLLPNWDTLTNRLLVANLRNQGLDARLLNETDESIRKSMRMNTGQCIPLNAIVQSAVDYINDNDVKPENSVLWSVDSSMSCNLGMYPQYKKTMLEAYGNGMENVQVYQGKVTFIDINIKCALNAYYAYMFGGMIRKMGCKIRPYEIHQGETDRVIEESIVLLEDVFENGGSKEKAVRHIVDKFQGIRAVFTERPKVAVFGDMYARDNDVMNQNLVRVIENNGGEVITTPYNQLVNLIAEPYLKKWTLEKDYKNVAVTRMLKIVIEKMETKYYKLFNKVLKEGRPDVPDNYEEILGDMGLSIMHTGESMENILKIFSLIQHYPDLSFFVQTNPAYCCPSLVTEAMAEKLEEITCVPIVTIEYDGTGSFKNDDIIPYLKYPRKGKEKKEVKAV